MKCFDCKEQASAKITFDINYGEIYCCKKHYEERVKQYKKNHKETYYYVM